MTCRLAPVRIYAVPMCPECLALEAFAEGLHLRYEVRPFAWLAGDAAPDGWRENGLIDDMSEYGRADSPAAAPFCCITFPAPTACTIGYGPGDARDALRMFAQEHPTATSGGL